MKFAHTLTIPFAIGLVAFEAATVPAAETVSPGAVDRLAVVETRCPTFSWGEEDGAAAYEIVAYILPEDAAQTAELTAETEALFTRVAGSATSWTPSADQCFAPGGRYVWFVRAVIELAGDQVIQASDWSAARYFTVPAAPSAEEMQRALDVLRRWDAANGGGSPTLSSTAVPDAAAASGTGLGSIHRTGAGAGGGVSHRKSVPTASAAIRGENPEYDEEAYGVVGVTNSVYGAGVAAANTEGGPDLVLDGSFDGGTNTALYEWGLDRSSPNDETFWVRNIGGGTMTLDVFGTLRGTALDCPGCVGPTDLADGAVTGAKIGAGAVHTINIADEAVGRSQIEYGGVGTDNIDFSAVTSSKIADGTIVSADLAEESVTSEAIEDRGVTEVDIAQGAVSGYHIFDGSVQAEDLAVDAISGAAIADGSITTADLADGSVTSVKIQNGAVFTDQIDDAAVTAPKIADGAVGAAQIAFESIGETELADGSVTNSKIDPGAVDSSALADGAVTGAKLGSGSVGASALRNNAVTTDKIADSAVTGAKILDGSVTMADLGPESVGSDQIEFGGVDTDDINFLSVGTAQLADGAVTQAKLAAGVIGSASIADGAVTTVKLAQEAVTTEKLANGAVNTNQLAPDAVRSAQIDDLAVVYGKIAAEAVTSAAIADGTITKFDIAGSAIESGHIADGNVTTNDLANDAVTRWKIAPNAVTSEAIEDGSVTAADIDPGAAIDADTLDGNHGSFFQPRVVSATETVLTPANIDETCSTYASVSITTSGAGFVVFDAISYVMIRQADGYDSKVYVIPSESGADCWSLWGSHATFGVPAVADSDDYWGGTVTVPHVFAVSSAGVHTFYLNVVMNQEYMQAQIDRAYLTAVYFPQ